MVGIARLARHNNRPITRILVGVAIAAGYGLVGAVPAGADPSPFNTLSCNCRETAPAGSPARTAEIMRGIQRGVLGLPTRSHQDPAPG